MAMMRRPYAREASGRDGYPARAYRKPAGPERPRAAVTIIGAASGLGAADPGCSAGPVVLRQSHLEMRLQQEGIPTLWDAILYPIQEQGDVVASLNAFCRNLAERVMAIITRRRRFAIIGGDHTCAIGTWNGTALATSETGPPGLIWIDAHMDAHTPETSPSGHLHGMPVACLLGYGPPALVHLLRPGPVFSPRHLCLIGVRSYEPEEARLLDRLGVRVILMDEVCRRGLANVLAEAVSIAGAGTAGFGISIDLDVVDPADAPGVSTPAPGGMSGADLVNALAGLTLPGKLMGVEIAEFNPERDRQGRTARLVGQLLMAALAGIRIERETLAERQIL